MNADGSGKEVVATGIRNTVGFDWEPQTGDLWFTDNGRDNLGNDVPPDELNHVTRTGLDFGFPGCHGMGIRDPQFGTDQACAQMTKPTVAFGAHVAALGLRFYTGSQFPAGYRNAIFVAQHGSWNRTPPDGYRLEVVTFDGAGQPSRQTFASGWLQGSSSWGRPVDVLVYKDGSLLVSDDQAGAVYRISYAP
jgi:glucose/arabinose dehydrogenase